MEITGKVTKIFDTQTFQSGFKKREVIVTTQEQYPQPLSIEFLQDKTELADQLNVGDDVKVSINLRGREWTSPDGVVKYFNSIVGWRVEKVAAEGMTTDVNAPSPESFTSENSNFNQDEDIDDLPF